MPTLEEVRDWIGEDLIGHGDERLGTISEIYLDEADQLSFLSVRTGLFGMKSTLVPIGRATQHRDHVHVPYTKEQVKDAPNVHDNEELTDAEEVRLYRHYRLEFTAQYEGSDNDSSERDASWPATDAETARSEDELAASRRRVEAGRPRLRRYVLTEDVVSAPPRLGDGATPQRVPGSAATSPAKTTDQDRKAHE